MGINWVLTNCFSCHKKLRIFSHRGDKKDVLRAGYQPPTGISDGDKLCQNCLDQIKLTQERGKTFKKRISVGGQIVWCFIFPLAAFLEIEKATKYLLYKIGMSIPTLGLAFYLITLKIDTATMIGVLLLVTWYVGGFIVPIYWIVRWTRIWNDDAI